MEIDFFSFIILVLATDAVLVVWFHGGGIFATLRGTAEAWTSLPYLGFYNKLRFFIGKAATCPICFPFYVTFLLFLLQLATGNVVLYFFAAAGLASRIYITLKQLYTVPG